MTRQASAGYRVSRYFARHKLTPIGRTAVVLMLLSALGASSVEIPVYRFFCGIVGVFGAIEFVGILMRPRLSVTASLPAKVSVGRTAEGIITVKNLGYFPAWDLMCRLFRLPDGLEQVDVARSIHTLRRGESQDLPFSIHAKRRGEYQLPPIHVHSTFPFNFMRFGRALAPPRKLTVVPTFQTLEQFEIPPLQRYQPGGFLIHSRSGSAPEYVGNREYVPGEPARRLDFRAWGRVGKPVVREYHDEYCIRVGLVLDTSAPPQSPWEKWWRADQRVDAAISLTASVADALARTQAGIDLFAAGPDLYLFQSQPGTTHFESVLEILAGVEASSRHSFEKLSPAIVENLESTSLVVCVFVDWDSAREDLVRRIEQSGCALRIIRIGDAMSPDAPIADEGVLRLGAREILEGRLQDL